MPITFEINETVESGKYIYLKSERQAIEEEIKSENPKWGIIRVYIRDLDNQSSFQAPIPNEQYNKEDYPYLIITKGLAEEIDRKKVFEIWKSGTCLGNYSFDLRDRLTA